MKQSILTRLLLLCGTVYSASGTHAINTEIKAWDHKRIVIGECAQDKSGACKTKTNAADYIQPSLSDGSLLTGTQNQFLESLGYKDAITYRRDLRQNTILIPFLGNYLEFVICDLEKDYDCVLNAAGGSAVEVALLGIGKVYSAGKRLILIGRKGQISKHTNVSPEDARRLEELIAKGGAKLLNPPINITKKGLAHTLDRHTFNGVTKWAKKSKFFNATEVESLIQQGTQIPMVRQPNGNFSRLVDAGKDIGIDRKTGKPTSIYTIITNGQGHLITAFPGTP